MPRQYLYFARIDMKGLPTGQRAQALVLELEQLAPFEGPDGWVVWSGATALVWYWQAERLGGTEAAPKYLPRLPLIPETALWPPLEADEGRWIDDQTDGLQLLQYRHPSRGLFEKRFAHPIDAETAQAWFRRHGSSADNLPPARGRPALGPARGASVHPRSSSLEARILPGFVVVLVFCLVMYAVALGRAWWQIDQLHASTAKLRSEVQSVVQLRNQATKLKAELKLLEAHRPRSQVWLADEIATLLDLHKVTLIRWQFRGGHLKIRWRSDQSPPSPVAMIKKLNAYPAFSNVQAQLLNQNAVELELDVKDAS